VYFGVHAVVLVAVAASLAQRKRWHLGSVEMLLGVKNERDPEWSPPPGQIPDWVTPRHIRAYRWLWWLNFRWAFLANNLPPLFCKRWSRFEPNLPRVVSC
jgi:hypothetical protein